MIKVYVFHISVRNTDGLDFNCQNQNLKEIRITDVDIVLVFNYKLLHMNLDAKR